MLIDKLKTEINSLDMIIAFIGVGYLSGNMDLTYFGMSLYQSIYGNKIYPKYEKNENKNTQLFR